MGSSSVIPPPPPGFIPIEQAQGAIPPPPAGFVPIESLQSSAPGAQAGTGQPKTFADHAKDAISEWWNQVNPVEGLKGARDAVNHPIDTLRSLGQAQEGLLNKAEESFKAGNHIEGIRHFLNYLVPVIGTQTDKAGDQLDAGEYGKGIGTTAGVATNIAAPEVLPKAVKLPSKLTSPISERLYQSALKPSTTLAPAERGAIIETGLKQEIPVSESGLDKIHKAIQDLNASVDASIKSNPAATIAPNKVASRLNDTAQRFSNQVAPTADLKSISDVGNDFLDTHGGKPMSASDAQDLKKGTYQAIGSRNYVELKGAQIEAEKSLARGIKEELEQQFPEIKGLNAQESKLYALEPVLAKAIGRISNHQVLGIGTPIVAGSAAAVTGSAPTGMVLGTLKAVMDNPVVKSRVAIMLNKAGRGGISISTANARVAGYANALAKAQEQNQSEE